MIIPCGSGRPSKSTLPATGCRGKSSMLPEQPDNPINDAKSGGIDQTRQYPLCLTIMDRAFLLCTSPTAIAIGRTWLDAHVIRCESPQRLTSSVAPERLEPPVEQR
jgi:hypothetical protein